MDVDPNIRFFSSTKSTPLSQLTCSLDGANETSIETPRKLKFCLKRDTKKEHSEIPSTTSSLSSTPADTSNSGQGQLIAQVAEVNNGNSNQVNPPPAVTSPTNLGIPLGSTPPTVSKSVYFHYTLILTQSKLFKALINRIKSLEINQSITAVYLADLTTKYAEVFDQIFTRQAELAREVHASSKVVVSTVQRMQRELESVRMERSLLLSNVCNFFTIIRFVLIRFDRCQSWPEKFDYCLTPLFRYKHNKKRSVGLVSTCAGISYTRN